MCIIQWHGSLQPKFNGATQVKEYMEMLQEEDPTKYEAHFSKYLENGIDAEKMEEMYTEAHEKIREDPEGEKADKKDITYERDGDTMKASDGTEHPRSHKITLEQRREKVQAKIAAAQAKMMEDWATDCPFMCGKALRAFQSHLSDNGDNLQPDAKKVFCFGVIWVGVSSVVVSGCTCTWRRWMSDEAGLENLTLMSFSVDLQPFHFKNYMRCTIPPN